MPIVTLQRKLGDRLLHNESLARYTSARLGGPAEWLYIARDSLDELVEVMMLAWSEGIPVRILGGGANVLVADKGVPGLTVINKVSEVTFGEWHDGRSVSATGGTSLTVFANKCQKQGLAGMGWAVSVPGTVGGAIVNNAGAHGADMADSLADVVIVEPSGPKLYTQADMQYAYRHSTLKALVDRRFLVLLATFILPKENPLVIKARMDGFIAQRKRTQPPGASLGSVFKNPPGDYAGRLIESAGLKGYKLGTAMVSPVHANFFINVAKDKAHASDYYALIHHVQETVYTHSGVRLELEIEVIGEW